LPGNLSGAGLETYDLKVIKRNDLMQFADQPISRSVAVTASRNRVRSPQKAFIPDNVDA
jgi:radical SAM superfamily enzyme with C-terminal helix-hairpin-helix motif